MNFLTTQKLVQNFTEIASQKVCHGKNAAPQLLVETFDLMKSDISDAEMRQIYKHFLEKVAVKDNWGYKQLASLLSAILEGQANAG